MNKHWTQDEIDIILKLYSQETTKNIAKILKRSTSSVISKIYKLKLIKPKNENVNIKCLNCSKEIIVKYSRRNAKFCSMKCKGEYTKLHSGSFRKCIVCGNTFYAPGNPKGRQICSKECKYEYRKTGIIQKCDNCGKEIYVRQYALKRSKNFFCCNKCANEYQKIEKIKFNCKICGKVFEVYPSTVKHSKLRGQKIQYCSIKCRNDDPDTLIQLIMQNNRQNKNKKRNRLEIAGKNILDELNISYLEQYLLNNKITVDVFVPEVKLIIEWWGDYWHGYKEKLNNGIPDKRQKKRIALDISQKKYFKKCGYKLLTFWEHDVFRNREKVKKTIIELIKNCK
jgi:very-short-patch-repair endonuclease